jgi:hypothetical protein
MKMIKKQTVRVGTVETELEAARIYDFLAILTEGLNVSKNISYSFIFFISRRLKPILITTRNSSML